MGKQVAAGTFEGGIAQLGEHLLCKQGVKGSNPFISTRDFKSRCTLITKYLQNIKLFY